MADLALRRADVIETVVFGVVAPWAVSGRYHVLRLDVRLALVVRAGGMAIDVAVTHGLRRGTICGRLGHSKRVLVNGALRVGLISPENAVSHTIQLGRRGLAGSAAAHFFMPRATLARQYVIVQPEMRPCGC